MHPHAILFQHHAQNHPLAIFVVCVCAFAFECMCWRMCRLKLSVCVVMLV